MYESSLSSSEDESRFVHVEPLGESFRRGLPRVVPLPILLGGGEAWMVSIGAVGICRSMAGCSLVDSPEDCGNDVAVGVTSWESDESDLVSSSVDSMSECARMYL